jgi:exopolysaccharide production protein ExoQ
LFIFWADLFAAVGKNTTFTGRTFIWGEYWQLIQQKIIFGHGYGAYPVNPTHWLKAGTHSGYVELLYYGGLVGAGIILCVLIFTCKGWWHAARNRCDLLTLCFCSSFLAAFLALNITETYMLNRSGLIWPLFIYCSLQLDLLGNHSLKNSA